MKAIESHLRRRASLPSMSAYGSILCLSKQLYYLSAHLFLGKAFGVVGGGRASFIDDADNLAQLFFIQVVLPQAFCNTLGKIGPKSVAHFLETEDRINRESIFNL